MKENMLGQFSMLFSTLLLATCQPNEIAQSPTTLNNSHKDHQVLGDGLSPKDADSLDGASVHIQYDHIFNSDGTLKYK